MIKNKISLFLYAQLIVLLMVMPSTVAFADSAPLFEIQEAKAKVHWSSVKNLAVSVPLTDYFCQSLELQKIEKESIGY